MIELLRVPPAIVAVERATRTLPGFRPQSSPRGEDRPGLHPGLYQGTHEGLQNTVARPWNPEVGP
jgi:hypothetical protein